VNIRKIARKTLGIIILGSPVVALIYGGIVKMGVWNFLGVILIMLVAFAILTLGVWAFFGGD